MVVNLGHKHFLVLTRYQLARDSIDKRCCITTRMGMKERIKEYPYVAVILEQRVSFEARARHSC